MVSRANRTIWGTKSRASRYRNVSRSLSRNSAFYTHFVVAFLFLFATFKSLLSVKRRFAKRFFFSLFTSTLLRFKAINSLSCWTPLIPLDRACCFFPPHYCVFCLCVRRLCVFVVFPVFCFPVCLFVFFLIVVSTSVELNWGIGKQNTQDTGSRKKYLKTWC